MKGKVLINQLALTATGIIFSYLILYINMLFLEYESFFTSDNFYRWDSGLYIMIVEKGLFMEHCHWEFGRILREPYYCGTAGWFPGYSYLISLTNPFIEKPAVAGMWISKLFFILSLYLFMVISELKRFDSKSILLCLCFTFFFGSIYYHAIFPISQFLFFVMAAFYGFLRQKPWLIFTMTFAACLSYSTGFLLGIALSLAMWITHFSTFRSNVVKIVLPALGSAAGLILHFFVLHLKTGSWKAFFMIQAGYGHEPHSPFDKVTQIFLELIDNLNRLTLVISVQSILVLISIGLMCFFFFYRRLYMNKVLLASFCYLSIYFLFPYVVGSEQLSLYRAESLLIPLLFFLKKLPDRYILIAFVVLLLLNFSMNDLFFKGILI